MLPLTEQDTRLVPYEAVEASYARHRIPAERTPLPQPGGRVWYRHTFWDTHSALYEAVVVEVQDLEDRTNPDLWWQIRDLDGEPVYDALGLPRHVRAADPWPLVWLHVRFDGPDRPPLVVQTQEARLRGSPGWLPLNYLARPVRLPSQLREMLRQLRQGQPTSPWMG